MSGAEDCRWLQNVKQRPHRLSGRIVTTGVSIAVIFFQPILKTTTGSLTSKFSQLNVMIASSRVLTQRAPTKWFHMLSTDLRLQNSGADH
jgi:hypothetical protein